MSRADDLFGEMPTLPPTFDPARDDDILAALTSGAPLPTDAPLEARLVADLFAALAAPAGADELGGLEAARAAFRTERGGAPLPGPRVLGRRRHAAVLPSRPRVGGRLVAASLAGVLGLGGVTAAAFAGVLPVAVQTVAHRLIGAPAPDSSKTHGAASSAHTQGPTSTSAAAGHRPTGTGPDATGPAAFGLCTAYDKSRSGDRAAYEHSVAYKKLVLAAGGRDNVATYCAAVSHPSSSGSHGAGAPSGKPSDPGSEGGHPSNGHPGKTGRPSGAPSHPSHSKSTSGPTATPPVVPPHPKKTKTKTATRAVHSPRIKTVGSTRTPR